MITVHNIVAASATVGLLGREGDLIRKTILPTIYYCFMAGGLSLVAIYGFGANLSTVWLLVLLVVLAGVILGMRRAPGKPNDELVEPGTHRAGGSTVPPPAPHASTVTTARRRPGEPSSATDPTSGRTRPRQPPTPLRIAGGSLIRC
jgi:lactate permease